MEQLLLNAERDALIEMVKSAQKQRMKGTKGDWKEFLAVHDKQFGASLSDPTKRSNDVLLAFLNTLIQQDETKVTYFTFYFLLFFIIIICFYVFFLYVFLCYSVFY